MAPGSTSAALQDALAEAEVHPLLCAVAHLTGDFSLLRADLAPDQMQMLVPGRGLNSEQEGEARALAAQALRDFDGIKTPVRQLTADELRLIFSFLVGPSATPKWASFLTEELAQAGTDPRAPSWHVTDLPETPAPRCAIVGAGVSGLAAAYRLRQAGVDVAIFEKNADVGGTWLENTYPGCRVDVPNQLYSFSFAQTDEWLGRFSAQADLLAYVQRVSDDLALTPVITFSTEVTEARWVGTDHQWDVDLQGHDGVGRTERFDFIICAVGQLNRPSFPAIDGQGAFAGPSFHSAEWDHSVSLVGQRVAVIGTGASAAQFVPHVADQAAQLDIYQRTPPWMLPTENYREPFSSAYHELLSMVPTYGRWDRLWQFWVMHEGLLPTARVDPAWEDKTLSVSPANQFVRDMLLEILRAQVTDAALLEKMVPQFPPFSKRGLRDDGIWAATLQRPHVQVIVETIDAVMEGGIRTADGVEHPADVVIYGTGFAASQFMTPMRVVGDRGRELNEQWRGDARAYLGITIPAFPNFFMLYGPNTNLVVNGSIIVMVECQIRYIVEALGEMVRRGHRTMSCRPEVHDTYNAEIDQANQGMAWGVADVPSWYKNALGRVSQNWPYGLLEYWERTRQPDLADYELR